MCLCNNFAICAIASLVLSPVIRDGIVVGGEFFSKDKMSSIDCRRKSSVVTFGKGI